MHKPYGYIENPELIKEHAMINIKIIRFTNFYNQK